ncbi:hypothetical protein BpHYR1_029991 [Brachionus plicatilis]|uniref:Uncharacterized protein n=1 Tax=Brachionus plicatilis TaxID=10195 RepID=A0A3M7QUH5_BRAPC|nr:hypothetical protein BpHYR1_029991 [Brachionus plicatilis]
MCQIFTSQHNSFNVFWITIVPSILPVSICVQKAISISSLLFCISFDESTELAIKFRIKNELTRMFPFKRIFEIINSFDIGLPSSNSRHSYTLNV